MPMLNGAIGMINQSLEKRQLDAGETISEWSKLDVSETFGKSGGDCWFFRAVGIAGSSGTPKLSDESLLSDSKKLKSLTRLTSSSFMKGMSSGMS